jgi:CRISPR-associated endonuclease Csn1
MPMRLGLDLGTNSLGWCLYLLDPTTREPVSIKAIGVRIFADGRNPTSKDSLAVERRAARSAGRRRDRFIRRRNSLLVALYQCGLMTREVAAVRTLVDKDPYDLRVRALEGPLHPHEVGRALFHLNQRRGFKSNRKADRKRKDKEDGLIRQGELALDMAMAEVGADTLGQFLKDLTTKRVRQRADGTGYDYYPQRRHYEHEFARIWEEQARHHPALMTIDAQARIHKIIFDQRPLAEQKVGKCTFLDEERLPKAHPLFQERRLYEEVNQLRIREDGEELPLTRDQRDKVVMKLRTTKKLSFATMRKSILRLDENARFNKESEARKELLGDEIFADMSHKTRFGPRWAHFDATTRWAIVRKVMDEENPDVLHDWLRAEHELDDTQAEAVARCPIPEGHGRLGETASNVIVEALRADVIDYDEAVRRNADLLGDHSDRRPEKGRGELPYYGEILDRDLKPGSEDPSDPPELRFGRIANPTVHIGLNQIRSVVNEIIKRHGGRPAEIVVEMARELKQSDQQRAEDNRRIADNTRAAEKRSKTLLDHGIEDNGANRMRLRLWEELSPDSVMNRYCPYCGDANKLIGIRQLFHSSEVDIDHILPYSRTLDDSPANKVIVHRECNRLKGNKTPHERWGGDAARWAAIMTQVVHLPPAKQKRFQADAMERLAGEGGFAERQLKDTQYLAVLTNKYLNSLYGRSDTRHVYVIPGRLTAMLRRLWGLNELLPDHNQVDNRHSNAPKNRLDHRHHAIDAAVTAATTHAMINEISRAAGRAENLDLDRLFVDLPQPWPGFREALGAALDRLVVSHRPDHGLKPKAILKQVGPPQMTAGRLHNDTAYGLSGAVNANGIPMVVHRVPTGSIKPEHLIDGGAGRKPAWIADDTLRRALADWTRDATDKVAFAAAVQRFVAGHPQFAGLRRARVVEALNVIPIRDRNGRAYKGYKGDSNYRYDVWELPDGSWRQEVVSMFDAHQPGWHSAIATRYPTARKVLRLHRDDVIAFDRDGARELMRVVKFSPEQLALAPLNEANVDARSRDKESGFRYTFPAASRLKQWQARQVIVDPVGAVRDPGFPARTKRRKSRSRPAAVAGE